MAARARVYVPIGSADLADLRARAAARGESLAEVARVLLAQAIEDSKPVRPARWVPAEVAP